MIYIVELYCNDYMRKHIVSCFTDSVKFKEKIKKYGRPAKWLGYLEMAVRGVVEFDCPSDSYINDMRVTNNSIEIEFYSSEGSCFSYFKKLMKSSDIKSFIVCEKYKGRS